jgi:hypothetical protein
MGKQPKILITGLSKIKTKTSLDEDSGQLITRIQFESVIPSSSLASLHEMVRSKQPIHAAIGSPQAVMELSSQEED